MTTASRDPLSLDPPIIRGCLGVEAEPGGARRRGNRWIQAQRLRARSRVAASSRVKRPEPAGASSGQRPPFSQ